jgi:hypothetical protein
MGAPARAVRKVAPQLLAVAVLAVAAAACLALNWPGHFTWDSVNQLAEGRDGVYSGQHPPVMSWLLGLADAVRPGGALFVVFDAALVFGALAAWACVSRPASWLVAVVALAACATPQLIVYPAIVWKDVLFAASSTAGFACLAWAAADWERSLRRGLLLGACVALLALAAMTRQNGAVVLPFAALAVGWIAARSGAGWRRGAAYGVAGLAACAALTLGGSAALNTRLDAGSAPPSAFRNLEVYDLVAAMVRDPTLDLGVLKARAPWLGAELRTDGVANYDPSRIDPMQPMLEGLDAHPEAAGLIAAQWRELILRHPWLYLRVRASAFAWVFLTPAPDQCVMVETGVDGDPDALADAGLTERRTAMDDLMGDYALAFDITPVSSHAAYAGLGVLLMIGLVMRRRPADIAVTAMLASAMAFAASFALISIACDYRYLYDLDLTVIAAALYASASSRGLWPALVAQQRQREARRRARRQQLTAKAE